MNINDIKNKLNNNFKDCYGMDKLSRFLIITGLIFSLSRYTSFLSLGLILYGGWRSFSKNRYKRYQELAAFNNMLSRLKQKFYILKTSSEQRKNYKIFTCPSCSQKLRIPRKQGNVTITCKKCGNEFKGKS